MGKKNRDVIHYGKRSWWTGDVKTDCGLTFKKGRGQEVGLLASGRRCPACKAAK